MWLNVTKMNKENLMLRTFHFPIHARPRYLFPELLQWFLTSENCSYLRKQSHSANLETICGISVNNCTRLNQRNWKSSRTPGDLPLKGRRLRKHYCNANSITGKYIKFDLATPVQRTFQLWQNATKTNKANLIWYFFEFALAKYVKFDSTTPV